MPSHALSIDLSRDFLAGGEGHNRWHPDIEPAVRVAPGDTVVMPARDGMDGQLGPGLGTSPDASIGLDAVHPLTGPVYVEGAQPGDLLEVEILDVEPDSYGFTFQAPGFGLLRDDFPCAFKVEWELAGGFATSPDLPGVRIPGAPFMGVMGVAPDAALLAAITVREAADAASGGMVMLPEPACAVPPTGDIARTGLRTIAPHETGGNIDIKQLTAGSRLFLPVHVPGALFSAGDGHFAQGDGESCGTAIEMRATLTARFALHPGRARDRGIRGVHFSRDGAGDPRPPATPERYYATTGIAVDREGRSRSEDLTVAARDAVRTMIDHLTAEYGYTPQQAYALCSVAVDLRISQVVDAPNVLVSAFLPLDVLV
ncbi:UNVERIFIED_ORG: acetamidase/formamidase family protein [Bacillus sp. AZ43]